MDISRHAVVFLVLLLTPFVMGSEGCPLTTEPQQPTTETIGFDIGGKEGALWDLSYEEEIEVTLRGPQGVATRKVTAGSGPIALLHGTFDLSTFCWRVDVACPDQVFTPKTAIVQVRSDRFLIGYQPKGPLSSLGQQGLLGTLANQQLSIPLGMVPRKGAPCLFTSGSGVYASATGTTDRAETIEGQVTVRYSGECITLGGSGSFHPDDVLELKAIFSASRL